MPAPYQLGRNNNGPADEESRQMNNWRRAASREASLVWTPARVRPDGELRPTKNERNIPGNQRNEMEGRYVAEKIWNAVDEYFDTALNRASPELDAALAASTAAALPAIQVSAAQGKLLYLLALTQGARRILEVGTLGGYSTLWLARALPADGRLVTLEINPQHAQVARRNFVAAKLHDRIELRVGPALESLKQLRAQNVAPFDLVFIDADKVNNLSYVQAALELSRVGTLIMVDNVVREGSVVSASHDDAVRGVRSMTAWVGTEPRLAATVVQTVGSKGYDGFLLARVQEI